MTPYFYKIKHKPSGKIYVGSQYGKKSDPSKLWVEYFTSSKHIKQLIESDGKDSFELIDIKTRDDAREYEQKYLLRVYYFLGRDKFLDNFLNRNLSPGILLTKDMIDKANEKRKISNSLSAKKLIKEGRHNFQLKPAHMNANWRKNTSDRMKGNTIGSFRKITDELRKKLSEKSKGNTNVRDTKWWTDGIMNRRCKECPGENFKLGFTKAN
jgi:hypothetical protein